MKLTKAQRESLRQKFDGKCAYCGHELGARWHADHFEPIIREWGRRSHLPPERPANDCFENLMPSCAQCNISKATLTIEAWRDWLTGHLNSLNQHHSIYRLMKAYGVVVETGKPIVFNFEKVAACRE